MACSTGSSNSDAMLMRKIRTSKRRVLMLLVAVLYLCPNPYYKYLDPGESILSVMLQNILLAVCPWLVDLVCNQCHVRAHGIDRRAEYHLLNKGGWLRANGNGHDPDILIQKLGRTGRITGYALFCLCDFRWLAVILLRFWFQRSS
uniref:Uncharacterized protein n=1 Tax=Oryza brachyantha TaxID=4533 RepID=J3M101_ORYBR